MLSWLPWRKKAAEQASDRWLFGTMLVFASLGLIAAFVLSVEKIHLLENPNASLSCSFNIIFNCATVMKTWQASLFGFPNSYIGLMGYPVVITLAVAGLSGVRFPRRFLQMAQVGFGLGLIFAYWLFFTSVYVIGVLCPWCLVVTVATTIVFETLLRYNLRQNNFGLKPSLQARVEGFLKQDYDKLIVAGWLLLMVALVILKFREGLL